MPVSSTWTARCRCAARDLRDWLPADHLAHFILDAIDQIPTAHFRVNHWGTGSEQYPPTMMLSLLIYCYATGRFGSRTIEAATHSDVAVRYLCAVSGRFKLTRLGSLQTDLPLAAIG